MTGDGAFFWLEQLALLVVYVGGGLWLGRLLARRKTPPPAPVPVAAARPEPQEAMEALFDRCRRAEETARLLRRTILNLPEIAQRLFRAESLRRLPDIALDLVEELFAPSYCVFYGVARGELVSQAVRGECEFAIGHRVKRDQGVVGWAALRQLPFTPEDAEHESATVRERTLSVAAPRDGFSVCLPVVSGDQTLAVILVGPTLRPVEHLKEFGRTITLLMSVAITNLQVLRREQHLATTDGLTSLLNKRAILEHLESCLSAGKAHRVSVFLFDVDHFKHYNDTNGHLAGDELLRAMGRLIREHSRDGEGLGRYGGEEFVLVMNDVDKPAALAAADRLRSLVSQARFPYGEAQPGGRLTISGGVATWPTDGSDVATLLRSADEALYVSKRGGRNRVTAYHAPEFAPLAGDAELTAEEEVVDGEG